MFSVKRSVIGHFCLHSSFNSVKIPKDLFSYKFGGEICFENIKNLFIKSQKRSTKNCSFCHFAYLRLPNYQKNLQISRLPTLCHTTFSHESACVRQILVEIFRWYSLYRIDRSCSKFVNDTLIIDEIEIKNWTNNYFLLNVYVAYNLILPKPGMSKMPIILSSECPKCQLLQNWKW